MSYSVLWTLLPNGINPKNGLARLSLVASPRLGVPLTKFGGSPLARWPDIVAALGPLAIARPDGTRVAATVVSAPPEQALWSQLVAESLPVDAFTKTDAPVFTALQTAYAHASAVASIEKVYADAVRTSPTEALSRTHPVVQTVAALQGLSSDAGAAGAIADDIAPLLDPVLLDSDRLELAAQRLRARGEAAAAEMLPLALMRRRRRRSDSRGPRGAADARAKAAAAAASVVSKLRAADQPDFHQVVGELLEHPVLALRVGLRIDLEIPAFTGEALLRATGPGGQPLNGPVSIAQPWSAVQCDPTRKLFVMQTQSDAPAGATEVVRGQIDLSPPAGAPATYIVTDIDVHSAQEQLSLMASKLASKAAEVPATLPPLRNGGLTVAQRNRRTKTIAHALTRGARFDGQAAEVNGAPVLYADDVTVGYRVDVSDNDGPFRSLMRRVVTYQLDGDTRGGIAVTDEGIIDGATAVEQTDDKGVPHLHIGEELFSWSGRSLAAHHPGPVASGDGKAARAEVITPQPLPGTPLRVHTVPEPGTLPRLRFGHVYRFRVRTVDLAGNSIDPEACERAFVSTPTVYRRLEPVPAPVTVARRAYQPGESHARLVVRSVDGVTPIGTPCERHIAPPSASQHLGELHGTFDAALGPDSPARAQARARLLAVGKRQDGAWTDPMVPLADGTQARQPGIAVVRSDPADKTPIAPLPLQRGTSLPPGQYVVHDTDSVRLPYLPDPAAEGAAFHGLPASANAPRGPTVLPYGAAGWPDARPVRLIAQAGKVAGAQVIKAADDRPALLVTVPPAQEMTIHISSALTEAAAAAMDPAGLAPRDAARQGRVRMLSRTEPVVLVHAVQKPLQGPSLALVPQSVQRPANGGTWIGLDCQLGAHLASTSRVDVEARWTEIVDTGSGPVKTDEQRAVVGSVVLDDGRAERTLSLHQAFDDTKHRSLTYTAIGTTRFTDCFAPPAPGQAHTLQRAGASIVVQAASTRRPPPPQVHSTLPILRWERRMQNGQYQSRRICAGVRVWLKRPWHVTGAGETLGVVLHASKASYDTMKTSSDHDLFTRWGGDSYEGVPGQVGNHAPLLPGEITNRVGTHTQVNVPGTTSGAPMSSFAVAEVPVAFDAERDLWYADIELDHVSGLTGLNAASWPFVRFALVRFQANTAPAQPGEVPPHASSVVLSDFVQLLPQRFLTATRVTPERVRVTLGSFASNHASRHEIRTRWQHRRFGNGVTPDICVDAPHGTGVQILQQQTADFSVFSGEVFAAGLGGPPPVWETGRIVVEERQVGWSVETPADEHRVVYREVFDYSVFSRPDGPL